MGERLRVTSCAVHVIRLIAMLLAAATPAPVAMPSPRYPSKPLHDWLSVEVNNRGQVVRIKGGELSKDRVFDTMTIGNALQMWIRKPDGSAQVGLYRVDYAYDPHTRGVNRSVSLISAGGTWANDPGAATKMADAVRREEQEAQQRIQAEQRAREAAQSKHLPDINAAVKKAVASPSPSPTPHLR